MDFFSKSPAAVSITAEGEARHIAFSAPGHLRVLASPQAVEGTQRSGADLVIHMQDGTVLVIRDYFLADPLPVIEFTGENGTLWSFTPGAEGGTFVLRPLAAEAGLGGMPGGNLWLAAVAVGGTALGLDRLLQDDSGSDARAQVEPPVIDPPVITPPVTEPPVTEPPVTVPPVITPPVVVPGPLAPPGLLQVGPDGGHVSGTGTPGAGVVIRDTTGAVLAEGAVGADGSFSVPLTPPVISGDGVSVTLQDDDGRNSPAVVVPTPDLTAPEAPADLTISPDGAVVSGRGEPGSTVIVTDADGTVLPGVTTWTGDSFTVTLTPAANRGDQLEVALRDAKNNTSDPVSLASPDLTAPEAPTDLTISPDGAVVSGRGEPGSTVIVQDADGRVLPGVTTWTGDSFTVTLTPPANRGDQLEVVLQDADNNTSDPAGLASPDLTPPAAPTELALTLPGVVLTGRAEAGALVEVSEGGVLLGSGTAGADGSFRVTLSPAQANGQQLLVTAKDAAGLTSPGALLTAADITPPGAATDLAITPDGTVVSGEGEPGATVIIRDDQGAQIGSGQVLADGSFDVTLDVPQQAGGQLQVVLRDAADLLSPDTRITAPDLALPPAPEDLLVDPRSGASLTGTGVAGAVVTVSHAGREIGRATVQADGSFTVPLSPPGLNKEAFEVVQSFDATRVSPAASVTAPDLTAPEAAENLAIDGGTHLLTGTGEPLARVTVTGPQGMTYGVGQIDASGNFSLPLYGRLQPDDVLTVTLSDAAGNPSAPETVGVPLTWQPGSGTDSTAPLAATDVGIDPATGASLSGKGEAGAVVVVYDAQGRAIASGLVETGGDFTLALTPPLKNGEKVTVELTDAAGNSSPTTQAEAPDLTAPDAARALEVSITGTEVTGLGEPGTTATVYNAAGLPIGSGLVDNAGRFTVTLNAPVLTGEALGVRLTDAAGLISPQAQTASPDRTAPDAPENVALSASGQLVTGTGEPLAFVAIRDSDGRLLGQGRVGANGSFSVQLTAVQLNGETLNVVLRDPAGNVSDPASLTAEDRTAPEAPENLALSHDGLILTGRGEAGTTVTVTGPGGSLGTATVAGNGSFTVNLTSAPPRGAGLSVTLRDAAGNPSEPGAITRPVLPQQELPLAQDNLVSLALDITPERSAQGVAPKSTSFSTANVGLGTLLDADVLSAKNSLQVEVAEDTARVVTLRGDAGGVTLLSRFALSLYRFDEVKNQWLLDSTRPDFLSVGLLGAKSDDLTVTLDRPGKYAFSLTPVSGVSVLTGYSLYMTADVLLDYSRPLAASGAVSGNLLSDPDAASGLVDTLPAGTLLHAVNGQAVGAGTVVDGTYGRLTIRSDGSYDYVVNPGFSGTPGARESFTYELRQGSGASTLVSRAELTITLDHNPVPPETLVVEVALDATPQITAVGSGDAKAIAPRSQVSLLELGLLNPILKAEALNEAQAMTFRVDENTLQSLTFQAEGGGLELGSQYSLVVYKKAAIVLPDGTQGHQWVQYHLEEDWLTIALLYGRADALPMTFSSGDYAVVMAGTGGLAVLGGMTLSVTDHSIIDYQTPAAISGTVTGDLTTGDTAGWTLTSVNGQALNTQPRTTFNGSYGRLEVQADGSYTYTAFAQTDPAWKNPMGQADTFLLRSTDGGSVRLSTVTFSLDTLASGSQRAEMMVDLSNALGGPVVSAASASELAAVLDSQLRYAKVFEVSGTAAKGARLTAEADALGLGETGISAVLYSLTEVTATEAWTVREGLRYYTREEMQTLSSGSSNEVALDAVLGELPPGLYQFTATISKPDTAAVAWSLDLGLQDLVADVFDITGTGPVPIGGIAFDLTSAAFASTTQVKAGGGILDLGSRTGPDLLTLQGEYGQLTLHKNGAWAYQASGSDFGVENFSYTLVSPSGDEAVQSLSIDVGKNVTGSRADDRVEASEAGDRFTMGAGADVVIYDALADVADIWTDFSLAGGDRLDLSALIGRNDLVGNLQVREEAGDSILGLLDSGTGGYRDLIVLENTSVTLTDLLPGLGQSYP